MKNIVENQYIQEGMHAYIDLHIHTHTHTQVPVHARSHTCMHTHIHIGMHAHMKIHIGMYAYTCTHWRTHLLKRTHRESGVNLFSDKTSLHFKMLKSSEPPAQFMLLDHHTWMREFGFLVAYLLTSCCPKSVPVRTEQKIAEFCSEN